jgi:hypothetical protein
MKRHGERSSLAGGATLQVSVFYVSADPGRGRTSFMLHGKMRSVEHDDHYILESHKAFNIGESTAASPTVRPLTTSSIAALL